MAYPGLQYDETEEEDYAGLGLRRRFPVERPRLAGPGGPRPVAPPMPDFEAPPQFEAPMGGVPDAMPGMSVKPQTMQAEDPFTTEWNSTQNRRVEHLSTKPNSQDKKFDIPMWQKIAMSAANGFAGYVNAGRRTHIDPISPEALSNRPKYNEAMQTWENEGRGIDATLEKLGGQYQQRKAAGQIERQGRLDEARIAELEARARNYDEPNQRPQSQNPVPLGNGAYWDPVTRKVETAGEPPKSKAEQSAAIEEARAKRAIEILHMTPGSPEFLKYTIEGKFYQPKAAKGGGVSASERADVRVREHQAEADFRDLEKEEQGLHEKRIKAGAENDKPLLNVLTSRLGEVYTRKFKLGKIDPTTFDQLMQGLKDPGTGAAPPPAQAAPAGTPQAKPARKPLATYDKR